MDLRTKLKQEVATRRQTRLAELSVQYGLSLTTDSAKLLTLYRAEDQNRCCAGCAGECLKRQHKYQSAVIVDGELTWEDCPAVKKILWRRQMEAERILPYRYAQKSWMDYDLTMGNHRAVEFASQFDGKVGLYISGTVGVGKTFLASLIAKDWILNGKEVIFGSVPNLMTRLQAKFNVGSQAAELLIDYVDCSLLVLDDFGTGNETKWKMEKLFEIIDGRYNLRRPIIITSNMSLDDLHAMFAKFDKDMADKLVSRLSQMCKQVAIRGADRRRAYA